MARLLGVNNAKIEAIVLENSNSLYEQAFQSLTKWSETNEQVTWGTLKTALQDVQRDDVITIVEK